jgi:hypothetical protein
VADWLVVDKIDRSKGFIELRYGLPDQITFSVKNTKLILLIGKPEPGSNHIPIEWVEEPGVYCWQEATQRIKSLIDSYRDNNFYEIDPWEYLRGLIKETYIDQIIHLKNRSPHYDNPIINGFHFLFLRNNDYIPLKSLWTELSYKGHLFELWLILGFIASIIASNLPMDSIFRYASFVIALVLIKPLRYIVKERSSLGGYTWTQSRRYIVRLTYWLYITLVFFQSIHYLMYFIRA